MNNTTMGEWMKFDEWKSRVDLIPPEAILEIGDVLAHWAKKYNENNWQNVTPFKPRYLAAAFRHLLAYSWWEVYDKESWLKHLAHAATCIVFLIWWENSTIHAA